MGNTTTSECKKSDQQPLQEESYYDPIPIVEEPNPCGHYRQQLQVLLKMFNCSIKDVMSWLIVFSLSKKLLVFVYSSVLILDIYVNSILISNSVPPWFPSMAGRIERLVNLCISIAMII